HGARAGSAAGILAWFAVGCPVCNKIALLALGYTGALTWFAPFQPVLAVTALILATIALVWRLKGQVACPLPAPARTAEPTLRCPPRTLSGRPLSRRPWQPSVSPSSR